MHPFAVGNDDCTLVIGTLFVLGNINSNISWWCRNLRQRLLWSGSFLNLGFALRCRGVISPVITEGK